MIQINQIINNINFTTEVDCKFFTFVISRHAARLVIAPVVSNKLLDLVVDRQVIPFFRLIFTFVMSQSFQKVDGLAVIFFIYSGPSEFIHVAKSGTWLFSLICF